MQHPPLACGDLAGLIDAGLLPYRLEGYPCIERFQADLVNSDRATAQTIRVIAEQIRESINTPIVQHYAYRAVSTFRGGPLYPQGADLSDERLLACSVWFCVKHVVKFREHAEQIKALLNEEDQLQLLIRPDVLLGMRRPQGDCAVFTPLVCALLGALNVRYEIVTIACDPHQPEVYSHVYARAVTKQGQYIPLDASHGKYPGWEVPREHQIRNQVWDENGDPIDDVAPTVPHLGQYRERVQKRVMPRRVGLGRWGLGDCTVDADTGMTSCDVSAVDTSTTTLNYPGMPQISGPPTSTTNSGVNWGNVLANALGQGINLAGKVVAPTTTIVRGPGGQLYVQTPAGSSTPLTATSLLSSGGGGNLLLIGGAVLIGILVLGAFKK